MTTTSAAIKLQIRDGDKVLEPYRDYRHPHYVELPALQRVR